MLLHDGHGGAPDPGRHVPGQSRGYPHRPRSTGRFPKSVDPELFWFVDVVEDRFDAIVTDARAVLDVAGTLEVGEGRFYATF